MKETLGSKIRGLRKEKGLTQRQLAEAVDIDFTYLSKIENDNLPYTPSTGTLKRLAVELGAEELELLRLAEKLPGDMQKIAHSKQALTFLRRASRIKSPREWDELFAFLEEKEQQRKSKKGGSRKK